MPPTYQLEHKISLCFLLYPNYDSKSLPQRSREIHSSSSHPRAFWEVRAMLDGFTNLTCLFFPQHPCFVAVLLKSPAGHLQQLFWEVALFPGHWLQAGSLPYLSQLPKPKLRCLANFC